MHLKFWAVPQACLPLLKASRRKKEEKEVERKEKDAKWHEQKDGGKREEEGESRRQKRRKENRGEGVKMDGSPGQGKERGMGKVRLEETPRGAEIERRGPEGGMRSKSAGMQEGRRALSWAGRPRTAGC